MKAMIDIHPAKYIATVLHNEKTHKLKTSFIMDGKEPRVLEQEFLQENGIDAFDSVEEMGEKLNEVLEGDPERYKIFWETPRKVLAIIFD